MIVRGCRWIDAIANHLDRLRGQFGDNLQFTEVGVAGGRVSAAILERFPGVLCTMVDAWAPYTEIRPIYKGKPKYVIEHTADHQEAAYCEAMERTEPWGDRRRVIRLPSTEAALLVPNYSQHVIFIDAAHDYEHVAEDVRAWCGKVIQGGVLCGHDWDQDGVRRAVGNWTAEIKRRQFRMPGRCWQVQL